MSLRNNLIRAERQAQLDQYRELKDYYTANRRPVVERITFLLALSAAILVSLRRFGIGYFGLPNEAEWVVLFYWLSVILFAGLDSIFVQARHPVSLPLGGFNPSRIFEKFSMQGRLWQLAVILCLPPLARIAVYAVTLKNISQAP